MTKIKASNNGRIRPGNGPMMAGTTRSTMDELAEATAAADKVIVLTGEAAGLAPRKAQLGSEDRHDAGGTPSSRLKALVNAASERFSRFHES